MTRKTLEDHARERWDASTVERRRAMVGQTTITDIIPADFVEKPWDKLPMFAQANLVVEAVDVREACIPSCPGCGRDAPPIPHFPHYDCVEGGRPHCSCPVCQ